MRIRRNILPRRLIDVLCFSIISIFLPLVFVFEIFVVLPECHEPYSFLYILTLLLSVFLLYNIKGNMIACMMIDTQVDYTTLKEPLDVLDRGWHYCSICERNAPPRSWHCDICKCCILKRDHHCVFTGCCIGHNNHRYFILFILYMFIGSAYALFYNSFYFWFLKANVFSKLDSLIKLLCPLLLLLTGSWKNIYLAFYGLNVFAFMFSAALVVYHIPLVIKGAVCVERNKERFFDKGWYNNLRLVFGDRSHMVWLSPLITSKVIHNGIEWETNKRKSD